MAFMIIVMIVIISNSDVFCAGLLRLAAGVQESALLCKHYGW